MPQPEPLPQPDDPKLVLVRAGGRVQIEEQTGGILPVFVDFLDGATARRRRGLSRKTHPLARAVGRRPPLPEILDGTAGFGRDAFVLACLGYRVTAMERSPVLHALLVDGVARLLADPNGLASVRDRLTVELRDCRDRLRTPPPPEVVYLDPMFPERRKSALVKKEMRLFQRLLGGDGDAAPLLAEARRVATRRVVVKRPSWAPPLADEVSYSVAESKVRWDVYLTDVGRSNPDP